MKRTIIVFLVVFMLLSLALGLCACGKKGICEMCDCPARLKKITIRDINSTYSIYVCEDCILEERNDPYYGHFFR